METLYIAIALYALGYGYVKYCKWAFRVFKPWCLEQVRKRDEKNSHSQS